MNKISFIESDKVGTVIYVDTNQVIVEVDDSEKISLINVGSIVAIQTTKRHEFIIGTIDKIRRKINEFTQLDITEDQFSEDSEYEEDICISLDTYI